MAGLVSQNSRGNSEPRTPPPRHGSSRPLVKTMRLLLLTDDLAASANLRVSRLEETSRGYAMLATHIRSRGGQIRTRSHPWQEPVRLRLQSPRSLAVARELCQAPGSRRKHVAHIVGRRIIHDLPACFNVPRSAPWGVGCTTAGLIGAVPVLMADVVAVNIA